MGNISGVDSAIGEGGSLENTIVRQSVLAMHDGSSEEDSDSGDETQASTEQRQRGANKKKKSKPKKRHFGMKSQQSSTTTAACTSTLDGILMGNLSVPSSVKSHPFTKALINRCRFLERENFQLKQLVQTRDKEGEKTMAEKHVDYLLDERKLFQMEREVLLKEMSSMQREKVGEVSSLSERLASIQVQKQKLGVRYAQFKREKVMSVELGGHRANIIKEFYLSEKTYVGQLKLLREFYILPLRKMKIVDSKVLTQIFKNFEVVYATNMLFLDSLEEVFLSYKREASLISLLLKNTKFFLGYSEYLKYYKKACEIVREQELQSKKFARFCQTTQDTLKRKGERISTLRGLLLTPVQRLPRYRLLLQQLLDKTPEDNPICANLKKSIEVLNEVIVFCSQKSSVFFDTLKVTDINKEFDMKIDHFSNKLLIRVDMGNATVSEHQGDEMKERVLLLMECTGDRPFIICAKSYPKRMIMKKKAKVRIVKLNDKCEVKCEEETQDSERQDNVLLICEGSKELLKIKFNEGLLMNKFKESLEKVLSIKK